MRLQLPDNLCFYLSIKGESLSNMEMKLSCSVENRRVVSLDLMTMRLTGLLFYREDQELRESQGETGSPDCRDHLYGRDSCCFSSHELRKCSVIKQDFLKLLWRALHSFCSVCIFFRVILERLETVKMKSLSQ